MPTQNARVQTFDVNDVGLTVTAPTSGGLVNSTTVSLAWVFPATQNQYRAQFFSDAEGHTLVYDSGWTASATQSASVNLSAYGLISNNIYYVMVAAHGTANEFAESGIVPFLFALPASVTISGLGAIPFPACNPTPYDNPSILFSWTQPLPSEAFLLYEVWRRKAGETDYIPIARITGAANHSYLDANVQPGEVYEYKVIYYGDTGTPVTKRSPLQTTPARASVSFDWTYLHEVATPQTEFLRYSSQEGIQVTQNLDVSSAITWGRQKPTVFVGEAFFTTLSLPGLDYWRRRPQEWWALQRMMERQSTVGGTLCLRSGIDRELYYVSLTGLSKAVGERSFQPSIELTEVAYDEDIGRYTYSTT